MDFSDTEYGDLSYYGEHAEHVLNMLPLLDSGRREYLHDMFGDDIPKILKEWEEESRNDE